MKIYFDGCSWTKGGNLNNKLEERFSRLVSDHFGAEETNLASSGGSNDKIIRNLIVESNIEEYDLAVIQMTYPARTEYYSGIPRQKKVFLSGWISVNPSYHFNHMIEKFKKIYPRKPNFETNTWKYGMEEDIVDLRGRVAKRKLGLEKGELEKVGDDIVNKRGIKNRVWTDSKNSEQFTQHQKFWTDYYRTVTTKEFFENKEKIQKLTIENYCQVKGVPLIICTQNKWTKENYELQMNPSGKGHTDAKGHRIIADKIIDIAKSKL